MLFACLQLRFCMPIVSGIHSRDSIIHPQKLPSEFALRPVSATMQKMVVNARCLCKRCDFCIIMWYQSDNLLYLCSFLCGNRWWLCGLAELMHKLIYQMRFVSDAFGYHFLRLVLISGLPLFHLRTFKR